MWCYLKCLPYRQRVKSRDASIPSVLDVPTRVKDSVDELNAIYGMDLVVPECALRLRILILRIY